MQKARHEVNRHARGALLRKRRKFPNKALARQNTFPPLPTSRSLDTAVDSRKNTTDDGDKPFFLVLVDRLHALTKGNGKYGCVDCGQAMMHGGDKLLYRASESCIRPCATNIFGVPMMAQACMGLRVKQETRTDSEEGECSSLCVCWGRKRFV